ncbi:MAG: lipase family protein [Rhodocyclales bacterium]|jgi:triacylglycerol lipase|nr:lipase family protein [Rhodocyclales bacterium]
MRDASLWAPLAILALAGLCWLLYALLASEQTAVNCLQCGADECHVAPTDAPLLGASAFPSPAFFESAMNAVLRLTTAVDDGRAFTSPPQASLLGLVSLRQDPALGAVLATTQGECWVVLRGSKYLQDWFYDARQNQVPCELGGQVHQGFHSVFQAVRLQVKDRLPADGLEDVVLTGHSMGAAVATLLALDLRRARPELRVTLLTSACPRIGDEAFCREVDRLVRRHKTIRNDSDLIPTLPAAVTPNFRNPFRPFFYGRCGETVLFHENFKSSTENHYITNYVGHWRRRSETKEDRGASAG